MSKPAGTVFIALHLCMNYIACKERPFRGSPSDDLGIFIKNLLKPRSRHKDCFTGSYIVLIKPFYYLKILRPKHKPFEFFTRTFTIHA